jgi:hypothetical protein
MDHTIVEHKILTQKCRCGKKEKKKKIERWKEKEKSIRESALTSSKYGENH